MERNYAYQQEVKRIMAVSGANVSRPQAEALAAVKFWPEFCPHCGERQAGSHNPDCPIV